MKSIHIICFVIFLFLAPYALCSVVFFVTLRKCLRLHLAAQHGERFKGFLEGQDVIWAMGDATTKGVINVMAFVAVDKSAYEPIRTAMVVLMGLRKRFKTALLGTKKVFPKLFYRKMYKWGYYYWIDDEAASIDKYVGYLELESDNEFITHEDLRKTISDLANSDLPDGNTRNWQFLVGNKPIDGENKVKIPVSGFTFHKVPGVPFQEINI